MSSSSSSSSCSSSSSSSFSSCSSSGSSDSSMHLSITNDPTKNALGTTPSEVDFGLEVGRILTQAGNYAVDLMWIHVRQTFGYNIYRAEGRTDDPNEWYKINQKIIQVNYYQDRGAAGLAVKNDKVEWFYKVIPVDFEGKEWPLSRSVSSTFVTPIYGKQHWVLPTILKRTNMMLDPAAFSSAEVCHFLVRKWAGEYCACLDVRTRKIDSNCAACFGTGYSGGYELIENCYCRVKSASKTLVGQSQGSTIKQDTTGTIGTYPLLTDGDIIIRMHNERFRVRSPKKRRSQNYITAQAFGLEKMQLSDMAYRVTAPRLVPPSVRQDRNTIGRSEG